MPKDDLTKLVSEYYSEEDIVKARDTYYCIPPVRQESRIRRKFSKVMANNNSTILDLMQETPDDEHLPLVCRDVCHIPPTRLGSLDGRAL